MGRQYLLKVTISPKSEVKYKGRTIEVFTSNNAKTEELVKAWYREKAKINL